MGFAVLVANVWTSVLVLNFPPCLTALQCQGAFTLCTFRNVVVLVLVFLFVPETKLKTLDELDEVFSIPSRRFCRYKAIECLPWWTKRYILRKKEAGFTTLESTSEYNRLDQADDGHVHSDTLEEIGALLIQSQIV